MTVVVSLPGTRNGEVMELGASQLAALDAVSAWLEAAPRPRYCGDPRCLGYINGLGPQGESEMPHTHGHPDGREYPVMSIGGLAGTGKTALAGQLADRLGKRVSFGTPTNKAAMVLRRKLPEDQRRRCGTYHSLLYRPVGWFTCLTSMEPAQELEDACGRGFTDDECTCPRFRCEKCTGDAGCRVEAHLKFEPREFVGGYRDLIVLDESSMITEEQVNDIRTFGLPVLLVGDHGQLPPVQGQLSPWMLRPTVTLDENYRQDEASGIIRAALTARQAGTIGIGRYGATTLVASGRSRPELYDALLPHRLPPGPDSMIITWTNNGRAGINRTVHAAMAHAAGRDPKDPLIEGDRLIALGSYDCDVVKPSGQGGWKTTGWSERAFNGRCGTVVQVRSIGKKTADVIIRLDALADEPAPAILKRIDLAQLGEGRRLREDERSASGWDYAYCLTAHKSQGSEASAVAVVGQGPSGPDRARWMYTAMTRAKEKLLVIL